MLEVCCFYSYFSWILMKYFICIFVNNDLLYSVWINVDPKKFSISTIIELNTLHWRNLRIYVVTSISLCKYIVLTARTSAHSLYLITQHNTTQHNTIQYKIMINCTKQYCTIPCDMMYLTQLHTNYTMHCHITQHRKV